MNLLNVYSKLPIRPVTAKGCYITGHDGRNYLDFYSGHGVISVGHNHPGVTGALARQSQAISYYSNAVDNPLQEKFAEMLCEMSGYSGYRVFFCNSGTEAVENALKTACHLTGRKEILAFTRSFHGRSSLALAVSESCSHKSIYNDLFPVRFLPWDDLKAAETFISTSTAAVMIEGIQGVGGIREPGPGFLKTLKELCEKSGALLILDEVQSGAGRSGDYFAHKKSGIQADIITQAKGLGNGFPVAAVLFKPGLEPEQGYLGSTFGGNHLACSVGIAVLEALKSEKLLHKAKKTGSFLKTALRSNPLIASVTGRGLMLGFSCGDKTSLVRSSLLERGILTGTARQGREIRLLPPLCTGEQETELFLDKLQQSLRKAETSES